MKEEEWRILKKIVRLDKVYVGNLKWNIRRIEDYKKMWKYKREI